MNGSGQQGGARSATGGGRTILLVDDDATLRELLADALARESYRVLQAADGGEGVAAALAGAPDIVISDIVMPEMNGWDLCQTLRKIPATRTVPFIFLTSLDQAPERVQGLRLGADDYLTKPFHLDTVLARVERLLGRIGERDRLLGGGEAKAGGSQLENILIDTIEFLRASKRTGVITVNSGPDRGIVYLERGALRHAVLGHARGEEALVGMLGMPGSQVTFKEEAHPDLPANVRVGWERFMVSFLDRGGSPAPRGACGT